MGRLAVLNTELDSNIWLNHSELSIAGRPLQTERVLLPRQRDLVLPESTDASADLRLAERQRPSPEQQRAQKGKERMVALLKSLLTLSEYHWDGPGSGGQLDGVRRRCWSGGALLNVTC